MLAVPFKNYSLSVFFNCFFDNTAGTIGTYILIKLVQRMEQRLLQTRANMYYWEELMWNPDHDDLR